MNTATLDRPIATVRLENQIADLVSAQATGEARAHILLKVAADLLPPHNHTRELIEALAHFRDAYHPLRREDETEDEIADRGARILYAASEYQKYYGHYLASEYWGM